MARFLAAFVCFVLGVSLHAGPLFVRIEDFTGPGLQPVGFPVRVWGFPAAVDQSSAILASSTDPDSPACRLLSDSLDLRDLDPQALWLATGTAAKGEELPEITLTSVTDRPGWYPSHIVYIGDSLTDGLDASSQAKSFREVLRCKLEAGCGTLPKSTVCFGVTDSQLRGMESAVCAFKGPWPQAVVIQDAVTVNSIFDDGTVTEEATADIQLSVGHIIGATIHNPGKGYRAGDPLYFQQGSDVSAEARAVRVTAEGGIEELQITAAGSYYNPNPAAGAAILHLNSYPLVAKRIVNDVLTRWGSPGCRPLVFFASCWKQGSGLIEYPKGSGIFKTWNQHLKGLWDQPPYRGHVFSVDLDAACQTPGAVGIGFTARVTSSDSPTWEVSPALQFDPAGRELYLIDESDTAGGPWYSKIVSSSGATVTVEDPRGKVRPWCQVRIGQDVRWKMPGRYGDTYHPTDLGHELMAEAYYQVISQEIDKAK